jgi:pyrroline-5-carboxylate reductase
MSAAAREAGLKRVALIGAGRMGAALAFGWLRKLSAAGVARLDIVEPTPSPDIEKAAESRKVRLNQKPAPADVVVLAVKPQGFADALKSIAPWVGAETLVISIMAGVTIKRIHEALGSARIVRAMPNTPGAIGKGVTGYALSAACGEQERETAEKLLASLGETVGPLDEGMIDAVTAVSGSGPAYVFLLAETMEAAGRAAGLDAETAARLARGTVAGAGALLAEGGDPAQLRKAVTSPGGTTAAALDVLMGDGAMPELMRKAVDAAVRRGGELAKGK